MSTILSRISTYSRTLVHADFGGHLVPYDLALQLQQDLRSLHQERELPDILLQLQHPPVYTIGKRGQQQDFLVSEDSLRKKGIDIHKVPRGGETTFHGPGQLILYPIVNLRRLKRGARAYVEGLEDTVIDSLKKCNIHAQGRQPAGRTGVWVEDRKIAALGVQISMGIATHGIALNVTTDLENFKQIVPCGLPDSPVTSIKNETRTKVTALNEVSKLLKSSFIDIFDYKQVQNVASRDLLNRDDQACLSNLIKAARPHTPLEGA